jgi:hypothetical protein
MKAMEELIKKFSFGKMLVLIVVLAFISQGHVINALLTVLFYGFYKYVAE